MQKVCAIAAMSIVLSCGAAAAEDHEFRWKSFLGKKPPELIAEEDHWLGTCPPVSLADLQGNVVWLQFNF